MAEYKDREHFIPLRKSDLITLLCKDSKLPVQEREPFKQFCILVSSVFHFEYLKQLEELKDAYAPFDPDADTKPLKPLLPEERKKSEEDLFTNFTSLLERANFKHLTQDEVKATLGAMASDTGVNTDVDLSLFERLEVFARGDRVGKRYRRRWQNLWRLEEVFVPQYQRLVLILKLRPSKRLDKDIATDAVYMKVLKNIPKVDLDMLLPGARVKMSGLDKALIILPLLAGLIVLGIKVYHTEFEHAAEGAERAARGLFWWSLGAAAGGYGYKSYHGYQVKKQAYNLRLTKSLYFRNLDNNTGVLMRLMDEAEEQECRETYLAYYFLLKHAPPQGWTSEQLDDYVEIYLEHNTGIKVDFEIGDALAKLERLKIVEKHGDLFRARPLEKALEMLDYLWDNYFKYNTNSPDQPPA